MHQKKILESFKCEGCGNCCRVEGIVRVSTYEMQNIAKLLRMDVFNFSNKYLKKDRGWLILADERHRPNCFLDENSKCTIYEARPKQCKIYPDWPEIWESEESFLKETKLCPGLKSVLC